MEKRSAHVTILHVKMIGLLAFLCEHYSTVYVIDYRYWDGNIIDFAREVHADDLLFANIFNAVNTGSNVGFLAMIIKKHE